jgi:hypothetical protein
MCKIYEAVSGRLISQYLNEAVMEPEYRVRVNKLGFCGKHTAALYGGENKLGLALQLSTRTDAVLDALKEVKDEKSAKREAEKVLRLNSTCVICERANETMERYAYTTAQMFANEREFPALFKACKGFCMPHYALMLLHAGRAGKMKEEYISALSGLQIASLQKINRDTRRFCEMFDYNSQNNGMKDGEKIVPAAVNKLNGDIIEPPK